MRGHNLTIQPSVYVTVDANRYYCLYTGHTQGNMCYHSLQSEQNCCPTPDYLFFVGLITVVDTQTALPRNEDWTKCCHSLEHTITFSTCPQIKIRKCCCVSAGQRKIINYGPNTLCMVQTAEHESSTAGNWNANRLEQNTPQHLNFSG